MDVSFLLLPVCNAIYPVTTMMDNILPNIASETIIEILLQRVSIFSKTQIKDNKQLIMTQHGTFWHSNNSLECFNTRIK